MSLLSENSKLRFLRTLLYSFESSGRPVGPAFRLDKCRKFAQTLKDIFYGMTTYEMVRDLQKERARREHLFVLITLGDLVGIPILPPYYALRLLPYALPQIAGWRCCLCRERDLTDLTDFET